MILTKEQSLLTKVMSSLEGESMKTQFHVLGYRVDLYFHDYKLAIEILKKKKRKSEEKRQKTIEQELDCTFIRIDPHK